MDHSDMRTHSPALALVLLSTALMAPAALAQDGLVATSKDGEDDVVEAIIDDSNPPPEQAQLDYFVGRWKCQGTSSTEYGAEVPTTYSLSVNRTLGNRWLEVKTELTPKAKGAKTISSLEYWGASQLDGVISLVRSGATSQGGRIESTTSGFVGERFDWSGTTHVHAKAAKEKMSIERTGPKAMTILTAAGVKELRVIFEGSCKR